MSDNIKSVPIFPSMNSGFNSTDVGGTRTYFNNRILFVSFLSVLLGAAAGVVAKILTSLIGLITNLSFYGKFSFAFTSPKYNALGLYVIIVPIIGAVIVGLMARYGSKGIRGHGIPEAMEQVLTNKSKIPPRLTFLKPLSAALSIGTGGPFGAEGPIISTGGALGSLIGQLFHTNSDERKILLSAGAAGGMAATFGSPISAILLAIELLLFEFKPRSFLPVTLASISATAVRMSFDGTKPIFQIPNLITPTSTALVAYFAIGILIGLSAVFVTKSVYLIEDLFEKLPVHWMWWPAIGAVAVGIAGYFVPATLGVGYDNITNILSGNISGSILTILFITKFISWSISLGSGTSGGTLAPLFTIGGGLGAAIAIVASHIFPAIGIDPRMAALVGMAALFTGASRAILTSIIFAFETTLQSSAILPLLACCSASYFVSLFLMKETIMTEKIARRGIRVPNEYASDYLDNLKVIKFATKDVISIGADEKLIDVRSRMMKDGLKHRAFPVIENNLVIGIITKDNLEKLDEDENSTMKKIISAPFVVLLNENTITEAADLMAEFDVSSIPVVENLTTMKLTGIISRNDILRARKQKVEEAKEFEKTIKISNVFTKKS